MIRLNDILDIVSAYAPDADLDPLKKAYVFSAKAHQGQTRRSGEPYLIHPLEVAGILAEMRLDAPAITAAILHDTVEDTVATLEEIEHLFGNEVKDLVDGVTKLSKIKFTTAEEKQAENFRKMVMAMAKDIRVILIKLADRLHNMRTLEYLQEEKRTEIAQETIDIYAPIANRLGIQRMKVELEDLAFKFLKPDVYHTISRNTDTWRARREKDIEELKTIVKNKMEEHGIKCEVHGRIKHIYGIYRKMERQNIQIEEVYDIVAYRIIAETMPECYEALGALHNMWRPVPGRFKDYIAMPKANNYQSLHTTVIGPKGERIEFQIRSRQMHDIAERGIAAHWKYKEGGIVDKKDEMKFKWIRQLLEWQKELSDPSEFLDTVKLDLFADDVYVFTPKGELRELPRGSTPVDFAYEIHSDIGDTCVGAKVNGRITPLKYELHSGDTVEILTQKGREPNKDWLQFVKTSKAKAKIRQHIRQQEHEQGVVIGRELFEKECKKYDLNANKILKSDEMEHYLKETHHNDLESLMVAISYGRLSPHHVLTAVAPKGSLVEKEKPKESIVGKIVEKLTRRPSGMVKISGISGVMVSFGKCCSPVPGDSITGFVTRGRGVSIHAKDCPRVLGADPARFVEVEWDETAGATHPARIKVVCADRRGMLANITEAITKVGVNITEASSKAMADENAVNIFELAVKNITQLRNVIHAIERIKGVISVERLKG